MLVVRFNDGEKDRVHAVKASNFFEKCFDEEAHDAYRNSEEGQARWDAACKDGDYAMCWLSGKIQDEFTSYQPTNCFDETALCSYNSWTSSEYALTLYQHDHYEKRPVFRVKFLNAELSDSDTVTGPQTEAYVYDMLSRLDGLTVERV